VPYTDAQHGLDEGFMLQYKSLCGKGFRNCWGECFKIMFVQFTKQMCMHRRTSRLHYHCFIFLL